MLSANENLVVGGFCPNFRQDNAYLFVQVFGSLRNGQWLKAVDANALFPPQGTIFVPPDLVPRGFEQGDTAAWEVEDQPNYLSIGHSARYRAVCLADPPIEILSVPIASDAGDVRKYLTEQGFRNVPHRGDLAALLRFTDGLLVQVSLIPHSSDAGRSVVEVSQFTRPLPAWKMDDSLATMTIQFGGNIRTFVQAHTPPPPRNILDLATLDEAVGQILKPGGLGGMPPISATDARHCIQRLEELLIRFPSRDWPARSAKLKQFLDAAREASTERAVWESFLLKHPVVQQTISHEVQRLSTSLKAEARKEILAGDLDLQQKMQKAEAEFAMWDEAIASSQREAEELETKKEELKRELDQLAHDARSLPSSAPSIVPVAADRSGVTIAAQKIVPASDSEVIQIHSVDSAITHLEKNLRGVGILKVSAKHLAQEVFVAASVGQIIFVKGAFAETVANLIVSSISATNSIKFAVPVGALHELEHPADAVHTVLINGANRACISSYGEWIRRLLQDRTLRNRDSPSPVIVATLLAGPGTLSLASELAMYGPVFDTDCLAWSPQGMTTEPHLGHWELSALNVTERPLSNDDWDTTLESLFPIANPLWDRMSRRALARLAAMDNADSPTQANASFFFGWVLPYFIASGGDLAKVTEPIRTAITDACFKDQRLNRLVESAGRDEA